MDARTFLGLEATDEPTRFRLPLRKALLTPGMFLFGGCGLAAGVEALESASGRPLVWATAQYLGYANPPATLDLDVTLAVHGHQITQGRCVVHDGDREILTVQAALGRRPMEGGGQWAERPEVPGPEACSPRTSSFPGMAGTVMEQMDIRQAKGRGWDSMDGEIGTGRTALWVRLQGMPRVPTAGDLAIVGDHLPSGVGEALGIMAGANSLDNTLRIGRLVATDWMLLDCRMHSIANGFAQGTVHIWADDGTLLGTASQSCVVRQFPGGLPPQLKQDG